ncbi:MAG TPA: 2-C-methyl-D-erythritol 4-phosphate cytidylyltransferase [Candidatus Sulfotelmatobacter sp.]|nr:2-C-methyl-D-erythritol 4-phosphate cytidylyltransferase [Candidatus Sulfotelmatobacter sp.]
MQVLPSWTFVSFVVMVFELIRNREPRQFELSPSPLVYLHPAMKVIVIIPAAGLGTRMAPMPSSLDAKTRKPHPSKQFTELAGTPILIHTLRKFAAVEAVNEIWIALRENEIEGFRERLSGEAADVVKKKRVELVTGGEHRQQSVEQALNAISAAPDDIILVHDAVRPLVTAEIILEVIDAAKKYGAAIAGLPAVDTVKQVERTSEGAIVKSTIPRAAIVLAQTPQGFHYSVIKKAFDEAAADGFMGTDESSLAERSGHEVAVVMGSPSNLKITTPADMELAEFYLRK